MIQLQLIQYHTDDILNSSDPAERSKACKAFGQTMKQVRFRNHDAMPTVDFFHDHMDRFRRKYANTDENVTVRRDVLRHVLVGGLWSIFYAAGRGTYLQSFPIYMHLTRKFNFYRDDGDMQLLADQMIGIINDPNEHIRIRSESAMSLRNLFCAVREIAGPVLQERNAERLETLPQMRVNQPLLQELEMLAQCR